MENRYNIDNRYLKQLRDLKLKLINGEFEFKPNYDRKLREKLRFISKNFENDIVTGSLALKLFGLLDREINDIDILIGDKLKYQGYYEGIKYGTEFKNAKNRLGYINFEWKEKSLLKIFSKKNFTVDFFEMTSEEPTINYLFEGNIIKVNNPIRIIEYKLDLIKLDWREAGKHFRDLDFLFERI